MKLAPKLVLLQKLTLQVMSNTGWTRKMLWLFWQENRQKIYQNHLAATAEETVFFPVLRDGVLWSPWRMGTNILPHKDGPFLTKNGVWVEEVYFLKAFDNPCAA